MTVAELGDRMSAEELSEWMIADTLDYEDEERARKEARHNR